MNIDTPNPGDVAPASDAVATPAAADTNSKPADASGVGDGKGADTVKDDAAKPADDKAKPGDPPVDAKPTDGKDEKEAGAPEAYAAFTLPEGYALEGERADRATALFKELNLPQAQAQKLIDAFVQADGENQSILTTMIDAKRQEQTATWGEESKTVLGTAYDESIALARKAVAAVEDPQLTADFNEMGWGNRLSLIRAFAFFGKTIGGDPLLGIGGETPPNSQRSPAEILYGSGTKT